MRMIIRYRGKAHVRSLSSADIAKAYGIVHGDVSVDRRVTSDIEVEGELGLRLIESSEWIEVSRIEPAAEIDTTTDDTSSDEEKTEDGKPSKEAGAPEAPTTKASKHR